MLARNAIKTPDGTIIESHHRHDFVSHTDKNGHGYFVDGGLDYARRGGPRDYEDLTVFEDADFLIIRNAFSWGSYGKNGDQELKWILLKDLETDHINKILELDYINGKVREWMEQELIFRKA